MIAEIVGHSDIRLTQNVYQHVFQPAKREAADKMNASLEDAVGKSSRGKRFCHQYCHQTGRNHSELACKYLKSLEPPSGVEPETC